MSKLNKKFDSITPPGHLEDRVKNAVADAVRPKIKINTSTSTKRGRVFWWRNIAAVATALAIFVSAVIIGLSIKGGDDEIPWDVLQRPWQSLEQLTSDPQLHAFESENQLKDYIKQFNSKAAELLGGAYGTEQYFFLPNDAAKSDRQEHSTTNNQVEGVAESDIVQTDGEYIYTVSYNELTIVKAAQLTVAARIDYEGFFPDSMFLLESEGLLVVLGSEYNSTAAYYKTGENQEFADKYMSYWNANSIAVKVYDIGQLVSGEKTCLRELKFKNTYYNSARMIGSKLYLILSSYNYCVGEDIWIPEFYDSVSDSSVALPANNIYASPDNGISLNYSLFVGLDVAGQEAAEVSAYLGSSGTVYASTQAFYISFITYRKAYHSYAGGGGYYYHQPFGTGIMRYEIDGIRLKYKGYNIADGMIVNQFAMDEYTYSDQNPLEAGNTYFRIATTLSGNTESRIFVFDSGMKNVGQVSRLGEDGERIYSVRFDGERAVVVTYLQTDPLYVIDLSKPDAPIVAGELKIDGVSDYVHFLTVKENYLFTVGRRQSSQGSWLNGLKVSVFDISGSQPREVKYFEVGGEYSYSEATYNHKAIMHFMPGSGDYEAFAFAANWGQEIIKNGYYLWLPKYTLFYCTIDAVGNVNSASLEYRANAVQSVDEGEYRYYTDYYGDGLRRSVVIGEYIYLIGYNSVQRYSTVTLTGTEYVRIGGKG